VTENYATNNLNQYTQSGTTNYSYDLDGNLISKTKGGQTWTYNYDDNNRLVKVVDSGNNITQYLKTLFVYLHQYFKKAGSQCFL
jgi:YD repeat-containing protein